METGSENDEIVEGLKRGDSSAFRKLYALYGHSILSYLTRVMVRPEMAEELTQETFLTAIRKIGFFKSQAGGGLRAWMFRIATHLAIDVLRKEKRNLVSDFHEEWRDLESDLLTPFEEMAKDEFIMEFNQAMTKLTHSQRMIFLLREQEEMSCMEISRACGCNENAVKQSLFRTRAVLRKKLCV